jgi:hypothetical protein
MFRVSRDQGNKDRAVGDFDDSGSVWKWGLESLHLLVLTIRKFGDLCQFAAALVTL